MTKQNQDGCLSLDRIDAVRTKEGSEREAAHLAGCPECLRVLSELEKLAENVKAATPRPPLVSPRAEGAVFAAFDRYAEEIKAGKGKVIWFSGWKRYALPLAAAASLAIVSLGVFRAAPELTSMEAKMPVAAKAPEAAKAKSEPEGLAAEKAAPPAIKAKITAPPAKTTILDAYRMALALEGKAPASFIRDFNGDGRADEADVVSGAQASVKLKG